MECFIFKNSLRGGGGVKEIYSAINLVARLRQSLEDEGERQFTAHFILFVSKGDFSLLGRVHIIKGISSRGGAEERHGG